MSYQRRFYCPNCGGEMDEGVDYCSLRCWGEFVAAPADAWINQVSCD